MTFVAGFAWASKRHSFIALLLYYWCCCLAISLTGVGKTVGPIWRGAIAGALMPVVAYGALALIFNDGSPMPEFAAHLGIACGIVGLVGLVCGIIAGLLVAAATSPAGISSPPE